MLESPPRIMPLGESAVVVEFGSEMTVELNRRSIALANWLGQHPFRGFIEAVPAYASVTVFYDLVTVADTSDRWSRAYEYICNNICSAIDCMADYTEPATAVLEIHTDFSTASGLDLEHVAVTNGIAVTEVIEIFTSRTYRVFMIGFLPGFAYMGEIDERIRMPRKLQPRLKVPKGSVGIAGVQTGVYPLESPGGWQIIGRSATEFFRPHRARPSLLKAGDLVRFVPT